jgi:hypothetical protein
MECERFIGDEEGDDKDKPDSSRLAARIIERSASRAWIPKECTFDMTSLLAPDVEALPAVGLLCE